MSVADIERLDEAKAFSATLKFEDLERFHVPFDDLIGTTGTEGRLAPLVRQGRRVAVRAASGEGKSSIIASVLGPLAVGPEARIFSVFLPVVGAPDETVTSTSAFVRFLLGTVLRWSDKEGLARRDRRRLEKLERDLQDRQLTRRAGITVPLWFLQPELASEVTRTLQPIANYADALGQLRRAIELLHADDKRPVLVMDDTDAWLQSPELDRHRLASNFFAGPFRALAKDLDIGIVLAVHPSYAALKSYQAAQELLDATIDVPRLDKGPAGALAAILGKRVRSELGEGTALGRVVEPAAIEQLARFYQSGHHSLRATLRVANTALEHARRSGLPMVTGAAADQAVAEELG